MNLELQNDLYFRNKYLNKIRDFYHETEVIKVITGVRRCGKSSLMKMIMKELLDSGICQENILYFNLDKRQYLNIKTPMQLDKLIEENSSVIGKKYLFVDEVQNVKDFESIINGWREEGDYSIFITGSNSYLLSGELATKLTGRYIKIDMYPLTFDEYIEMKEFLNIPLKDDFDEMINFIYDGGFPYTLKLNSTESRREYTKNLIEEIFEKDISSNIKIRNKTAFYEIMKFFISNFGATTSIINIVNELKNKGINIKVDTVNRYLDVLEKAKILIRCDRFDMKSKKALLGEKKYYLSDLSFYNSINTNNKINYGPVLENIIHNYALTMDYKVSVGKIGKLECDFIMRKNNDDYAYVQVAYTILASIETENREYRSLENIVGDNYPKYVMTTDRLIQKRNGIKHVNLIEFMKNKQEF